jgi:hypothetical protein
MPESSPEFVQKAPPRKWAGWPPASRNDGWIKTSGIPLLESAEDEFFAKAGNQFSIVGPLISEAKINEVFPESFPGKDDLIRFYLRFNGGSRTPQGCVTFCSDPAHRVSRDELEKLHLEGFRSIPPADENRMTPFANILTHHATMSRIYALVPEATAFLEGHMEIAFDHSGQDLCISRQNGRVFFMDWDAYEAGPVEIASSFREFVEKFWNVPLAPID